MTLTNDFIDAVSNNKMTRVRIMLKDIMLVDPSLKTFNEMVSYAEKGIPGLYDQHDGEVLTNNSSDWTEDYMNQQMVSVVTNFSKERVTILAKVVKHLYGDKNSQETDNSHSATVKNVPISHDKVQSETTSKRIAGGIIAIAGVGSLVGGIVGSSVPIAIIGGVAIVGGIALSTTGRSKGE